MKRKCVGTKWNEREKLEDIEHDVILEALKHHGCISITAKELGIARATLYRKISYYFQMEPKELMNALAYGPVQNT